MLTVEVLLILLGGGLVLTLIEFTATHRRMPLGSGEVLHWLMRLGS